MSYPGNNHYSYQNQGGGGYGGQQPLYGNYEPPQDPSAGYFGAPPSGPAPYGAPPGNPDGYNYGSYNQGGYEQNSGYDPQGPYNQGGYSQTHGRYNQDSFTPYHQSYNQGYSQGGYGQGEHQRYTYAGPQNLQRPPTGYQQFGNGAPSGYGFQYSNCQGRKKALLIGINYIGQKNELKGCINDVKNISNFLTQRYGYKYEDMVILTDDQMNPRSIPTKANMISAMQWLVRNAQPNDSLFFHYSGHGGQTEDRHGDEDDAFDEVVYPVDYKVAGQLVDDEMHEIIVRPLQPGVRLTAIFDSCHSGTALDLPYVYSTQGVLKEPNLAKEAGMGLLSAFKSYSRGDLGGAISSITGVLRQATSGGGSQAAELTKRTKTSPADVVMFSGCKDSQTSADSFEAGRATGAMSWAFIEVLNQNPQQSYITLLQNMRQLMAAKYSQKPQLSSSHPIDTNLQFIL
ncbi:caspase domain-containing protein [Lipomyces tetrasporus]|uniref:Metacaspase-1 n=1 Tax=Lipomyces tetrasporus TaxID=54092 RepID=A0AAD7QVH0_9ASCO|nr:caspase domain-containing protein [Lipomyces tetrasporus]KAJ8102229.1 caspase domain-containing protein [Lipomyces tetrasporus]